jgi:hypothetical protein
MHTVMVETEELVDHERLGELRKLAYDVAQPRY